jgi:deoxyribodipyrimidine photo-lyase
MRRTILWFRNDLRLHDNPIVAEAMKVAKTGEEIVPVFCFDDRFTSARNVLDQRPHAKMLGDPKMGRYRAKFIMECVNDLRRSLCKMGSDLLVYYDRPENVLPGAIRYPRAHFWES